MCNDFWVLLPQPLHKGCSNPKERVISVLPWALSLMLVQFYKSYFHGTEEQREKVQGIKKGITKVQERGGETGQGGPRTHKTELGPRAWD